ncbi:unnamed protein product, partial [Closterium sp. Yama58-4]
MHRMMDEWREGQERRMGQEGREEDRRDRKPELVTRGLEGQGGRSFESTLESAQRLEGQGSRSFPEFLKPHQLWDLDPSDTELSGPEVPGSSCDGGGVTAEGAGTATDPFDFLDKPVVKSRLALLKEKKKKEVGFKTPQKEKKKGVAG